LLHALDRKVWEVKVAAITESTNYETLTVEELFSKLKSTEIDINTRAKIEKFETSDCKVNFSIERCASTSYCNCNHNIQY